LTCYSSNASNPSHAVFHETAKHVRKNFSVKIALKMPFQQCRYVRHEQIALETQN
jgi:hypothetical protein